MSGYLSFYRKYRPSTFSQVVEQQNIVQVLETSVSQKQINHAYLFVGEKGTGKTSVARIFAKAINCLDIWNQAQLMPCNKCEICIAINNHNILDIVEIDAASYNGVDDIRQLINNSIALPLITTYKVFIVDEAHMLTTFAFNALLKTLEEPPKHLIFILATTKPDKIPLTIFSRCQQFTFKKIKTPSIITTLQNICTKENILYDNHAIEQIANCADGSLRDALSMLEQSAILNKNNITLPGVLDQFALLSNSEKINFLASLSKNTLADTLHKINSFYERGINIVQFINDLILILKDILFIKKTEDPTLSTVITQEDINAVNIDCQQIITIIDLLLILNEKITSSKNSRIFFELYMFKICEILKQPNLASPINIEPSVNDQQPVAADNLLDEPYSNTSFVMTDDIEQRINDYQPTTIDYESPVLDDTPASTTVEQEPQHNFNYEDIFNDMPQDINVNEPLNKDFESIYFDETTNINEPVLTQELNVEDISKNIQLPFVKYENDIIQINQINDEKTFPIVFETSKRDIINVILQSTIDKKEAMVALVVSLKDDVETTQYWFIKTLFKKVNVVAACDEAVILTFSLDNLNELKTYYNINKNALLRWAFKTDIIVYCLWESDWFNYRNDFYKLKQSDKLPEPFNITNNYRNR